MAPPDIFKRLSQLLELPAHVIRGYVGPVRVKVAARRVRGVGAYGNRKRQNELYKKWRDGPHDDKPLVAGELFEEVLIHARNLVWRRLPEAAHSNLPRDIASAVIERLEKFRGKALFTTWVHRIILNLANLELRKRVQNRERFVQYDPDDSEAHVAEFGFVPAIEQALLLERVKKEVSCEEYGLLECMIEGMSTADIAGKFGTTEDAAETRRRRLVEKLRKKFVNARRKVTSSSN